MFAVVHRPAPKCFKVHSKSVQRNGSPGVEGRLVPRFGALRGLVVVLNVILITCGDSATPLAGFRKPLLRCFFAAQQVNNDTATSIVWNQLLIYRQLSLSYDSTVLAE